MTTEGEPDDPRAERYALRGITGTDAVAFAEVARQRLLEGARVLDFGCGAGRSSRFLTAIGNRVTGVDISAAMVHAARTHDPGGSYELIERGATLPFGDASFDGFFSSWALIEEGDAAMLRAILAELGRITRPGGTGVVIVNTRAFYAGDWVSCDVAFPENRTPLVSGQRVRARLQPQGIVVDDYFWTEDDYRSFFAAGGLAVERVLEPLADAGDGARWRDETRTAPFAIWVVAAMR